MQKKKKSQNNLKLPEIIISSEPAQGRYWSDIQTLILIQLHQVIVNDLKLLECH